MNKNLFLVSAFLLVFVYVNAQIPTNGLVAWYPFTGNTLDSSGNNNHGTNNGATLTTDRFGKANSAYSFNGSSNNISIGNFSNWDMYKSNFTMSVWFETNDTTHTREQMLIGKDSACSGPGQFRFEINEWGGSSPYNNISVVATGLTNANQFRYFPLPNRKVWINAIIVKSNKNSFMYVNGNLVATYTNDTSVTLGSYSFNCYIGARLATPSCATKGNLVNFFWGKLDDIRIYNRTLDSASVQALYHEGGYDAPKTTIPTNGLVAWYPFTGNTLDSSGNNNHGTNNGATLTTDRFGKTNCAYQFNGTNGVSRIRVPDSKSLTVGSALTISLWVKYNSLANNANVFLQKGTGGGCLSTGYNLSYDNNFGSMPYIKGLGYGQNNMCAGIVDSSNLDNNWHHIVVVYNPPSGNTIYFDGISKGKGNFSSCPSCSILNSTNPLYIGNTGYGIPWDGKIDDIRIYNKSIDSTGVQALYHEGGYLGIPLPVKFEDISGLKSGNAIKINWHSSTEQNTSLFIIQHSTDGTSFTDIGTVKAIGSGANSYQFTDNAPTPYPLNGVLYYRLKSVDKDGSSTYSKVISVQLTIDNFQLSITPNPAKSIVTIKGNHIASIQVIDNLGRVVKTVSLKDATNPTLSVSGLPMGVYHLRVQTTDGKVNGVGFVKE